MDYTLSQVERIASDLREIGVTVPGRVHSPPSTAVPVTQETEVTTSKTSRSGVYLPQWLQRHRFDPATMVTRSQFSSVVLLNYRFGRDLWNF